MYLCIYASMYQCIYVSMYVCMYVYMYVCMCIYIYIYTHAYIHIYIYIYNVYIYIYIICVYICIYIYIYTHTYTSLCAQALNKAVHCWRRRAQVRLLEVLQGAAAPQGVFLVPGGAASRAVLDDWNKDLLFCYCMFVYLYMCCLDVSCLFCLCMTGRRMDRRAWDSTDQSLLYVLLFSPSSPIAMGQVHVR